MSRDLVSAAPLRGRPVVTPTQVNHYLWWRHGFGARERASAFQVVRDVIGLYANGREWREQRGGIHAQRGNKFPCLGLRVVDSSMSRMFHFRTLGAVAFRRADGAEMRSVRMQPKRVALLAYLAAARPRGPHRRDELLALLWPDHDESRARNALRQALHGLRRVLGEEALVSVQEGDVILNRRLVWCDAAAFEGALEQGESERAASLYAGPFLRGFYLAGAPEFERWVGGERDRLARSYGAALAALAEEAEARGDLAAAAAWWLRGVEHDGLNARVAMRLMHALAASGDRAEALRHAARHADLLREELGAEPDPAVTALAEEIRRRPVAAAAPRLPPASPAGPAPESPAPGPLPRAPRAKRPALWVGSLGAGVLAVLLVLKLVTPASGARPPAEVRVAVLPFDNLGAQEDEYLGAGVTDELAARLTTLDAVAVIARNSTFQYASSDKPVPEIGRELGAPYLLTGAVKREHPGDSTSPLRITPRLLRASDGTHVWADVFVADLGELFEVTSRIAAEVGRLLEIAAAEPERLAAARRPTEVAEAYEYYLRGREYHGRPQSDVNLWAALELFEKSIQLDTAFAPALAALSEVHGDIYWFGLDQTEARLRRSEEAVQAALRLDPTLPEAHRALGTYRYRCCLDFYGALQHYAAARRYRPGIDQYASMAVVQRQAGRWEEALASLHRAVELDPRSARTMTTLGKTYLLLRRFEAAERYLRMAASLDPQSPEAFDALAQVYLFGYGDPAGARGVLQAAARTVPSGLGMGPLVSMYARRFEEALAELARGPARVLTLSYAVGHGDSEPGHLYQGDQYRFLEDTAAARVHYDSARSALERRLRQAPPSMPAALSSLRSRLGRAYAGLGREADAIREGRLALALARQFGDAITAPEAMQDLAVIFMLAGEPDSAVAHLRESLRVPSLNTVWRLRLSPTWDPLRGHPGFRRLTGEVP